MSKPIVNFEVRTQKTDLLRYENQKYASRMGEGIVQDDVACALPVAPSINHANSGPFVRHRRILFHAATG